MPSRRSKRSVSVPSAASALQGFVGPVSRPFGRSPGQPLRRREALHATQPSEPEHRSKAVLAARRALHPPTAHPVRLRRCCLVRDGACPSIPRVPLQRAVRASVANARRTRRAVAQRYRKVLECAGAHNCRAAAPRAQSPTLCTPATKGSGAARAVSEEPYDTTYDIQSCVQSSRRHARRSSGDV